MSEKSNQDRSLRTAIIGTSVIFWILAVFIINSMNGIRQEIDKTNQYVQTYMSIAGQANLGGFQLVDPNGKVVYTFQRLPEQDMEMLEEQAGACARKAGCGSGACALQSSEEKTAGAQ
jgi:hypothetical protein